MSTKLEGKDDTNVSFSLAPRRPSKLVLIVGLVAVIITAQAIITYLLIPKSPQVGDSLDPSSKDDAAAARADVNPGVDITDSAEVSVGDFSCTNSTAAPGVVIHVDFKLFAVTTSKQSSKLDEQMKSHQARIRQTVHKIVRSSSLEDLNDPNLGTIKRLIREEINRLLHMSLITEIVVSDIRTMEQ